MTELASRYEILAPLGHGGAGVVRLARDRERDELVALKSLRTRDGEQIYQLKREFRALSRVRHRNLVQLHDLVVSDDECFFTMEFVRGVDFVGHVRRGGDERRRTTLLRAAFSQLVQAVAALHDHGKLHRDLKPSNVLVDENGRVVVLDFGLASSILSEESLQSRVGELAGTLAYMAPEQAWGDEVGPASDWYGVGVILYESLTGRAPFAGSSLRELLEQKQRPPTPPADLEPKAPPDLAALALRLLDPDPGKRPGRQEILDFARLPPDPERGALSPIPTEELFVGREDALRRLHESLTGSYGTVLVRGTSGIGKSALVERFASEVQVASNALVLRARCNPREAIPFKAVDGIVDGLTRYLLRLPESELAPLLPRHASVLPRIFPVLERLPAMAKETSAGAELQEVQRRGFTALRELLARIAERQRLVLWIDDLQWGDHDSIFLLRELARAPDPPRMTLVLSFRSEDEGSSEVLRALRESEALGSGENVREIALGALSAEHIQRLVGPILEGVSAGLLTRVGTIVREAGGNPFFAVQLARYLNSAAAEISSIPIRLSAVVAAERESLSESARRLLELVAVAGAPLGEQLARRALGGGPDVAIALAELQARRLVRTVATRSGDCLSPYHDRIREIVVALLPPEAQRERHRAIAEALDELSDPDPHLLVEHWLEAGEPPRAADHAYTSAERAVAGLAFDRAADFYQQALALGTRLCEPWRLHTKIAEAQVCAGRGAEGAVSFLAAARALEAIEPEHVEVLRLRRTAAERLMRSAHHERGLELMKEVLGALGERYAPTPASALRSIVSHRARLTALRWRQSLGVGGGSSPAERERMEALWSAGVGTSLFDAVRAADFQVRHALLAHRLGDPAHVARSLATEALILTWEGGDRKRRRSARLRAEAERQTRLSGSPNVDAHARVMDAAASLFERRFRESLSICEQGEQLCRDRCVGAAWELANFHHIEANALVNLGELERLRLRLRELMREAQSRGDAYTGALLRVGLINLAWLAEDRIEEAELRVREGLEACGPNAIQNYQGLYGVVQNHLYRGEGGLAWKRLAEGWGRIRSAQLLRLQSVRIDLQDLAARSALVAAVETSGGTRTQMLRRASRATRRLASEGVPWAAPLVDALRGGIAAARGQHAAALAALERAAFGFDHLEMRLHASVARYQVARLSEGADGGSLEAEQERLLRSLGVHAPARIAALLVPGVA